MMLDADGHVTVSRLLRNRVSAQQARERKKSYVSNLEQAAKGNEQTVGYRSLVLKFKAPGSSSITLAASFACSAWLPNLSREA